MRDATQEEIERPYDGCGKCLLGVRRLSRMKAATSSPERQRDDVLAAAEAVGGHIIGWADDWEVSGATDPMTRPKPGPGSVTSVGRTTDSSRLPSTGWAAMSSTV